MTSRCRCVGTSHTCGLQNTTNPKVIYVGQGGPKGAQGAQGPAGSGAQGIQGPQGVQGTQGTQGQSVQGPAGTAVTILGSYPDYASLIAAHPTGNPGDSYLVNGDLYVWTGSSWTNVGNISGPQGVQGETGAQGTQGLQGTDGGGVTEEQLAAAISSAALGSTDDLPEGVSNLYFNVDRVSYIHTQGVSSSSWVITHNLGFYPNITTKDSAGSIVEGEIVYDSANQVTLNFQAAFSGMAYLS